MLVYIITLRQLGSSGVAMAGQIHTACKRRAVRLGQTVKHRQYTTDSTTYQAQYTNSYNNRQYTTTASVPCSTARSSAKTYPIAPEKPSQMPVARRRSPAVVDVVGAVLLDILVQVEEGCNGVLNGVDGTTPALAKKGLADESRTTREMANVQDVLQKSEQ